MLLQDSDDIAKLEEVQSIQLTRSKLEQWHNEVGGGGRLCSLRVCRQRECPCVWGGGGVGGGATSDWYAAAAPEVACRCVNVRAVSQLCYNAPREG